MIRIADIDGGSSFDFGKTSEDYAKYRDIYPRKFYETLLGYQIGAAGQDVLDLGTGTGVLPRHMVQYGAKWTGADISSEQIAMAGELTGDENIRYIVAPADRIPAEENSFDAATACQCFWYFPKDTTIPEIKRVLRPGGKFAVLMMIPLPKESAVVSKSEELVLKYNPGWTGAGFDRVKPAPPPWLGDHFKVADLREYVEDVEFTREGWRGRMLSCRGVGASLPPERVAMFDREHNAALCEMAGDMLLIPHQFSFEIYDVVK